MITLKTLQIYFTPNKKTRGEIINDKITKLNKIIFDPNITNEEVSLIIRTLRDDGIHELKRRKSLLDEESIKTTIAINKL